MQIWKFELDLANFEASIPKGADVLTAGVQGESIMIWAIIDPAAEKVRRRFPVFGTGHEIQSGYESLPFIGTVFMGPLVLHVFDAGEVQ